MKLFRMIIGIILVVASLLKLATICGILHIAWFERATEEPWATYFVPCVLILVGVDLIYNGLRTIEK